MFSPLSHRPDAFHSSDALGLQHEGSTETTSTKDTYPSLFGSGVAVSTTSPPTSLKSTSPNELNWSQEYARDTGDELENNLSQSPTRQSNTSEKADSESQDILSRLQDSPSHLYSSAEDSDHLDIDDGAFQTSLLPSTGLEGFGDYSDELNELTFGPESTDCRRVLRSGANLLLEQENQQQWQTVYNLRGDARDRQNIMSTWIDADDSGNYDPYCKPRPPDSRKRKKMASGEEASNESDQQVRKALRSEYSGKLFYYTVKIQFTTDDAKRSLIRLTQPEDSSQEHTGSGRRIRERTKRNEEDYSCFKNHPIARSCKACHQLCQPCTLMEPGGTYPCQYCVDEDQACELLIPPERKADCETCKRRRIPCSYLGCGGVDFTKPCLQCQQSKHKCIAGPAYEADRGRINENGSLCRPRRPQRRSVTCTPCKNAGLVCSLTDRHSGSPPCTACVEAGDTCVFLPKPSPKETQAEQENQPEQPLVDQEPLPVSSTSEESNTPMVPNSGDSLDAVRKPASPPVNSRFAVSHVNNGPAGTSETNRTSGNSGSGDISEEKKINGDTVKCIVTRMCHPVTFSTSAATSVPSHTCHWCRSPFFGMIGHPERRVQVREWSSGKGCVELRGGHYHENKQPSRMCLSCTTSRAIICACAGHSMQKIVWDAGTSFDVQACAQALIAAHNTPRPAVRKKRKEEAHQRFCSVCNNLAKYKCHTPNPVKTQLARAAAQGGGNSGDTVNGGGGIGGSAREIVTGCGLRLCHPCHTVLMQKFRGDLAEMVARFTFAQKEFWPHNRRADAWVFARRSYMRQQILFA